MASPESQDGALPALPEPWQASPFLGRCAGLDAAALGDPPMDDEPALKRWLRQARRARTAELARRNLRGQDDAWATIAGLSDVADALLGVAMQAAQHAVGQRHGVLRDADGRAIELGLLALGKLGGRELNFSSDVDVVFTYRGKGDSDGERPLDAARYCVKVAQQVIALLEPPTADGFAYRVDTRLRPFGSSGPIAVSVAAMEQYYETHGRTWERYALIKARAVVDTDGSLQAMLDRLNPFVYRRYLDFTAIESLRAVHREIAADVQRKEAEGDLKRGRGGIREAEFVVQAMQLIWGGGQPDLRTARWRDALAALLEQDKIDPEDAGALEAAYVFLRQVENRVQMWDDRQTHSLPETDAPQAALAAAFGAADYPALLAQLDAHREVVWALFSEVVGGAPESGSGEHADALIDAPNSDAAERCLREYGLEPDAIARAQQAADALRRHPGLQGDSKARLRRVWPRLMADARVTDAAAVGRIHAFLDEIAGRSTYLALLDERPDAAEHLVRLLSGSPAIAAQLTSAPAVLDELLDPRVLYAPPAREELFEQLQELLECAEGEEDRLDALREFRNRQTLRVAAAEITGAMPLMRVSDHLSWIAEAVVSAALELAGDDMAQRHGRLPDDARLAVVAYGKLGGLELNYGSDLDLVFLYDADPDATSDGDRPLSAEPYMIRWAQRLIHWLTTRTREGRGYEVDTRLRPSGNAGLMVTRLSAFEKYQQQRAWTWEHQALVRARCVAGPDSVRQGFDAVRLAVLQTSRDPDALAADIRDMRGRLRAEWHKQEPGHFDLKHGQGGIMDLEFLVQFLVLAHSHAHAGVAEYSDNVRQLDALGAAGVLSADDASALKAAYLAYRSRLHELTLQEARLQVAEGEMQAQRAQVVEQWTRWLGGSQL